MWVILDVLRSLVGQSTLVTFGRNLSMGSSALFFIPFKQAQIVAQTAVKMSVAYVEGVLGVWRVAVDTTKAVRRAYRDGPISDEAWKRCVEDL